MTLPAARPTDDASRHPHSHRRPPDPRVFCVRGPSRSGKTSVVERLAPALSARGFAVAVVKRTHHDLDLPSKSSARVWQTSPAAMLIHAPDRRQITLPPGDRDLDSLVASIDPGIDVVVVETHTPEPYPTVVAASAEVTTGEEVLSRWSLDTLDADASAAAAAISDRLPAAIDLHRHLRRAAAFHGGHACAGLVLGTRLALHGAELLEMDLPDRRKRLVVSVEIDRCAADAVQAVTGCRVGRRTLHILDYGKLAATLVDTWNQRALRVAVRGDLRDIAANLAMPGEDRHEAQRRIYLSLPPVELFVVREASPDIGQFDLPGPPKRRVLCAGCGEEVSDGRDILTDDGPRCRPCAAVVAKGMTPSW